MTEPTTEFLLRAKLNTAVQYAARSDANRARLEAELMQVRAATLRSEEREAHMYAETVAAAAALAAVCRLCNMTITESGRVAAVGQARDTLAVIEATIKAIPGSAPLPGDAAWGSVWRHGDWRRLTKCMTPEEREHAADAVARWNAAIAKDDADAGRELDGLRWWRDAP